MPAIEFTSLSKYFGAIKAVDSISFSVNQGEVFGFLGPNGAGKTTTIRCLMDFLRPSSGAISIFGLDSQRDAVALKHRIGYVSGNVRLYRQWTGWDHIRYMSSFHGRDNSSARLIADLEYDPSKRAGQLSSGNRQKLGIILAFLHNPNLLILDEPTTGLDPLLQNALYDLLRERVKEGATVFFSSHNLPEVERVCDRVGIIRQGRMAAVERIDSLKEKKVHRIQFRSAERIDASIFSAFNVTMENASKNHMILEVRGDAMPVVKLLSGLAISDLTIERAPLEHIFMEYYT